MAIKKIPCGGWSYDDTEIAFEDGVIHPIGGGGGAMVVNFVVEDGVLTADTTPTEVKSAMLNTIVVGVINTGEADIPLCACVTGPGGEPQFQIYSPTGDAQVFINVQDDEWALNV